MKGWCGTERNRTFEYCVLQDSDSVILPLYLIVGVLTYPVPFPLLVCIFNRLDKLCGLSILIWSVSLMVMYLQALILSRWCPIWHFILESREANWVLYNPKYFSSVIYMNFPPPKQTSKQTHKQQNSDTNQVSNDWIIPGISCPIQAQNLISSHRHVYCEKQLLLNSAKLQLGPD